MKKIINFFKKKEVSNVNMLILSLYAFSSGVFSNIIGYSVLDWQSYVILLSGMLIWLTFL